MPTPAAHINDNKPGQVIVWQYERSYDNTGSTGASLYSIGADNHPFFNSNPHNTNLQFDRTLSNIQSSNSNKKFINLDTLFKQQYKNLAASYEGIDIDEANSKMAISLSSLLEISPDVIAMELTHEQSIFYTLKKDNYTFFIQHFLNEIDLDDDEATLTVFKGNDKLPSFAGSLSETIFELNNLLLPSNTVKFELQLNELSY